MGAFLATDGFRIHAADVGLTQIGCDIILISL